MERIASCELPMSEGSCARERSWRSPTAGRCRRHFLAPCGVAFKPGGITGVATVWALVGLPGRPYVLSVIANYEGDGNAVAEAASAGVPVLLPPRPRDAVTGHACRSTAEAGGRRGRLRGGAPRASGHASGSHLPRDLLALLALDYRKVVLALQIEPEAGGISEKNT